MQIINNPCSCFVELRDLLSRVPKSDVADLRSSLRQLWPLWDVGATGSDLLKRLLNKLGSTRTYRVVQMFSHGDKKVEADGDDLPGQIIGDLNLNGTDKLLKLFQLIKGKEALLLQTLGE